MYLSEDKLRELVEEFDHLPTAEDALYFAEAVLKAEAEALEQRDPENIGVSSLLQASVECWKIAQDMEQEKFGGVGC